MELHWTYKAFNELTLQELYAIIQLRIEVFSVEQQCVYQDLDEKDQASFHLCGWDGKMLVAYCRLLPAGLSYDHPSIGRVVTALSYRKGGHGRMLMQKAIAQSAKQFNDPVIIISAQQYLQSFYSSLGFYPVSDMYLEDNIPHIKMKYKG